MRLHTKINIHFKKNSDSCKPTSNPLHKGIPQALYANLSEKIVAILWIFTTFVSEIQEEII